jgi:hypothetical protein
MSILFGHNHMQLSVLLRKLDKRRVRLLFSRHDDSCIDHINGQFQPFCSGGALRI